MGKILTCLMFIPLAVVTFWEISTHSCSSPVGIGFLFIAFVSGCLFFFDGFFKNFNSRFSY